MRASRISRNKRQSRQLQRARFGSRRFERLEPRNLLAADVVISEIMYQSFTDLGAPEDYREEFVELLNRGDTAADLLGWKLSDGVQFEFPQATLGPGEYLVVTADPTVFHARHPGVSNYIVDRGWDGRLSNSGENVELVDQTGRVVDRVQYSDEGDWSVRLKVRYTEFFQSGLGFNEGLEWSNAHDGGGKSLELVNPGMTNNVGQNWGASLPNGGTPGTPNSITDTDVAPLITDVEHAPAVPRSADPIAVRARVRDELPTGVSVTLFYREDGEVVFDSLTMFDDALHDDEYAGDGIYAGVIDAGTFANGVIVEYYVRARDAGGNIRTWPAPVAPVAPATAGGQIANCLFQIDDSFNPDADWTPGTPPEFRAIATAADWNYFQQWADVSGRTYKPNGQVNATLVATDGVSTEIRYELGLRNRGNGSRAHNPHNLRLNLPHDRPYKDYKALVFNAQRPYAQSLGSAIFRYADISTADGVQVKILTNGVDRADVGSDMYGHYLWLETMDTDFVENHWPADDGGNLYKCNYTLPGGRTDATLEYIDDDADSYRNEYNKQTNVAADDFSGLIQMLDVLNNTPDETFWEDVNQVIDVRQWVRFMGVDTLLGNSEGGLVTGDGDDYGLYEGVTDPRFKLVPYDLDSIIVWGSGSTDRSIWTYRSTRLPGLYRLLNHPNVAQIYYQELTDLIDTVFTPQVINPLVDQVLGDWRNETTRNDVKVWIATRVANVLTQIPQHALSVQSSLPVIGGYPRTTDDAVSLSGTADLVQTKSIRVGGLTAEWDLEAGTWSISSEATVQTFRNGTAGYTGTRDTEIRQGDTLNRGAQTYLKADLSTGGVEAQSLLRFDNIFGSGAGQIATTDDIANATLTLSALDDGQPIELHRMLTTWGEADNWSTFGGNGIQANGIEAATPIDAIINAGGAQTITLDVTETVLAWQANPTSNRGWALLATGTNGVEFGSSEDGSTSRRPRLTITLDDAETVGVPLPYPGLNRVVVQAFDGEDGSGNKLDETYIDVWSDVAPTIAYPQATAAQTVNLVVPNSYLPGEPVLVRVEVLDPGGDVDRDLWDATANLSASGGTSMDVDQIRLFNGLGSALVTFTGSGPFDLTVDVGGMQDSDDLTDLTGTPVTIVSGTLSDPSGTDTWSGVVHITGDVLVPDGHLLSIEPGTLIRIDGVASGSGGTDIDVQGEIQSLGTEDRPITFTAYNATQAWGEIHHNDADASLYRYTNITLAGHAPGGGHTGSGPAVRVEGSNIVFEYTNITDNVGKVMQSTSGSDLTFRDSILARSVMGPEIDNTALLFEDSWITENHGPNDNDGIYIHSQSAGQDCTLRGGVIADMHDDGLDTLWATVLVEDFIFRDMADKGVSVYGGEVTLSNVVSVNNDIGISAKDPTHAVVRLDHATISGNRLGIQAENKGGGMDGGLVEYFVTNSIVYGNTEYAVRSHYPLDSIDFDYSIVGPSWVEDGEHADPAYAPIVTVGAIWAGTSGAGAGTSNDNTDPLFVNPAAGDFYLQAGSPAIGEADDGTAQGYYPVAVTPAAGQLAGDTVWRPENGQYRVTSQLTVPAGRSLSIMPGTTVFFDAGASLLVEGTLMAEGTAEAPIRFTRAPGAADWDGIRFVNNMNDNVIRHAFIEHVHRTEGMIDLDASKLTLEDSTLANATRRRISAVDSSLIVRNSIFEDIFPGNMAPTGDNVSEHIWGSGIAPGGVMLVENNIFGTSKGHNDAIDFNGESRPGPVIQILGNTFLGGGDDALDLGGDAHVEGNVFTNFHRDQWNNFPNSNVISAGAGFDYVVTRNVFYDSDYGVQVKEGSFLTFVSNTVADIDQAAIYFVKPGSSNYGDGAYVEGNVFVDVNDAFADVGPGVELTVHYSLVDAEDVALGVGNLTGDARLADPAGGDFSLASGSAAIGTGRVGRDMGADVPAGILISLVPLTETYQTEADFEVAGYDYPDHSPILAYKWRLNGSPWSTEQTPGVPIVLAGLSDGPQLLEVIAQNSAGAWQDDAEAVSASWTVDTSLSRVLINEVLAENNSAYEHESTYPDVIELYNDSQTAANLGGWSISDDPANPTRFVFPGGTTIPAEGYLVLYADDAETPTSGIHLDFQINGDGERVYLYDSSRTMVDSIEFGPQLADLSIGRTGPDRQWSLAKPTIDPTGAAAANVAQPVADPTGVLINEWFTNGDVVLVDDFIELYNPDTLPVDLAGLYLTDNPANQKTRQQISPLSFIGALGCQDLKADGQDRGGHVDFRLSAKMGILGLFDGELRQLDRVYYGPQTEDVSQGRMIDGIETIGFFALPTPGLENIQGFVESQLRLLSGLRITELMYNPAGSDSVEFVELQNTGTTTIDLTGARFSDGVDFVFPAMALAPGEYIVVARDLAEFQAWYGTGINAVGSYDPDGLSNAGEDVLLQLPEPYDAAILRFEYDDNWYTSTDGDGLSLVIADPTERRASWRERAAWQPSTVSGGSPGEDDPTPELAAGSVVVNEVLAHSDGPLLGDWIELHNTTATAVDVSGWFLSDDAADPQKYVIPGNPGNPFAPANTILPAGGYIAFNQVNHFGGAFGLSEHGDTVIVSSCDLLGNLGTYRAFASFGATENSVTLGRHINSTGKVDFVAMAEPVPDPDGPGSYGAANGDPLVGPIVIEEIMYHPVEGGNEYVLLRNVSGAAVDLFDPSHPDNTWMITGGTGFTFPQGVTVPVGGYVLIGDVTPAVYRAAHEVPAGVQVFGPLDDALSNAGERITLQKPGKPEVLPAPLVPYITAESVRYDDDLPWPEEPDGNGPALTRLSSTAYGNDPANWGFSGPPTVTVDPLTTENFMPTLTGTVVDAHMPTEVRVIVGGRTYSAPVVGGIWTLPIASPLANGTYDVVVTASDAAGNVGTDATTDELVVNSATPPATVRGRYIFYDNSAFDVGPALDANDGAIAPDKQALLPGEVASFANYTSYSRGINGIMVDLAHLPGGVTPVADDFQFRVGNDDEPDGWSSAPAPAQFDVRTGAGKDGSDRVTLTWPDGAIHDTWLEVTVLSTNLVMVTDDVFYFGNSVAEAGNADADAEVTVADLLLARNNPRNFLSPAAVDFPYDYNRDSLVNATDVLLARNNRKDFFTALKLIDLSVGAEEAPGVALADVAWLRDLDQPAVYRRPADKNDAANAIDKLLATGWPE